jgi:hypothetical protein
MSDDISFANASSPRHATLDKRNKISEILNSAANPQVRAVPTNDGKPVIEASANNDRNLSNVGKSDYSGPSKGSNYNAVAAKFAGI